jgi:outer membrane protein TolC
MKSNHLCKCKTNPIEPNPSDRQFLLAVPKYWQHVRTPQSRIFNPCHPLQLACKLHSPKARINMVKMWMKPAALLALSLAGVCRAQDTGPLKLTLKDAVALALKQNPQVILANLAVSQSEQDRLTARSALLPQANANLSEAVNRLNLQAPGRRFQPRPRNQHARR